MASNAPVVLSVVGHNKRDPNGIFLLEQLLTEQIKTLRSDVTVLHVVLDHHEKNKTQEGVIGFVHPLGLPKESSPCKEWLNYYSSSFYPHLKDLGDRVTHVLGYAPEFVWGAINIREHFFPKAKLMLMVHEQISSEDGDPGEELLEWTRFTDIVVSLGKAIYDDVEAILYGLEQSFEAHKKLCYLPTPPQRFIDSGPRTNPPPTGSPVIVVLAGDLLTQKKQKMNLAAIVRAISKVAEDMKKAGMYNKIAIRMIGIPKSEREKVKNELEPSANSYVRVDYPEASSFDMVEKQLKMCHMCILPLGCATDAFGIEMMVPVTFGVPTLVPDSATIINDMTTKIIEPKDHRHLKEMIVHVLEASNPDEEESAWKTKIQRTLVETGQVQASATALRNAIIDSECLKSTSQQFIDLIGCFLDQQAVVNFEVSPSDNDRKKQAVSSVPDVSGPEERSSSPAHSEQTVIKSLDNGAISSRNPSTEITCRPLRKPISETRSSNFSQTLYPSSSSITFVPHHYAYDTSDDEVQRAFDDARERDDNKGNIRNQNNKNNNLVLEDTGNQTTIGKIWMIGKPTRQTLLMYHWAKLVDSLDVHPLMDVMLSNNIISYGNYEEVNSRFNRTGRRQAVHLLLGLFRRRGEEGISLLQMALRDPNVNCYKLADLLEP